MKLRERHFLPYHGVHTIVFEGKALYLQDGANAEILHDLWEYLTPLLR